MGMQCPVDYVPRNWHLPILANPARFKVIVAHRKASKTTLAICELLRWAAAVPGVYWYIAPYLNQAKKIVWEDPGMLAKYCPPSVWDNRNNSDLYLKFPNGSILYILGADKPDSLRGPNPKGTVFDEYDDMRPEIWSAILQPVVTANQTAWVWFLGTYKGRRDLYRKHEYAKVNTTGEWHSTLLKASQSGIIGKAELEEAKNTTTEAIFKQEFECEPLDNAAEFFKRIDANVYGPADKPDPTSKYQVGADIAKYNDWTVITPFDLNTFKVGKQDRFNQVDYNLVKARIENAWMKYNKGKVVIDSTGVGEPVYDDLKQSLGSRIEPFRFTEKSRTDLLMNLQLLIEQDKIKLPNDPILLEELRSFQYVLHISKTGKPRVGIEVPENQHDDCVMSLALAVWGIPDKPIHKRTELEKTTLAQFDAFRKKRDSYLTGSPYLR